MPKDYVFPGKCPAKHSIYSENPNLKCERSEFVQHFPPKHVPNEFPITKKRRTCPEWHVRRSRFAI